MATLQTDQRVFALLPATVLKQEAVWIKTRTDIVVYGAAGADGVPRRRLSNMKLGFASFITLDDYGYLLKRPLPEHIGQSQVRLFSDGLDWLNQTALEVSPDALKVALSQFSLDNAKINLAKVIKSNPTYESKAYKDFLAYFLPKGTPFLL